MSMRVADDLETAEDLIGQLEPALRDALRVLRDLDVTGDVRQRGLDQLRAAAAYCRPSCDTHGEPHDDVVIGGTTITRGEARCSCPCHDRGAR